MPSYLSLTPAVRFFVMLPAPDDVQACVLSTFAALPAKCKPRARDSHAREWVPLAGIVVSRGTFRAATSCILFALLTQLLARADGGSSLTCVALG